MWPTTPELRHRGVRVVAHDGAVSCLVQNWLLLRRGELGWGCGTIWTCSTASCDVTIILKISKSRADRHLDQRACDLPHLFTTPAVILYTPAKATLPDTLARPTCNENNSLLTPSRSAWTSGTQFSTAPHFPTGRPSFPRDDEFNNSEYTETRVFDQQVQPATEKPGAAALKMHDLYSPEHSRTLLTRCPTSERNTVPICQCAFPKVSAKSSAIARVISPEYPNERTERGADIPTLRVPPTQQSPLDLDRLSIL